MSTIIHDNVQCELILFRSVIFFVSRSEVWYKSTSFQPPKLIRTMAIRIALNGFGRIGRQITRLLFSQFGAGVELLAINSLETIDLAAHLLRYDSNHGIFEKSVTIDGSGHCLVIDGQPVRFLNQSDPSVLPWHQLEIDLVIEASGHLTHRHQAERHLQAGARKVLITAAAHSPDITLCLGVNHDAYRPDHHHIVSGSSCTTNCLAPAVKLLNDHFTIQSSLATFLHSYTSSQHLLDLGGKDFRRMRAAPRSIIPTTTSAAQQLPVVIPELIGRFDALAIRVPTPEVHLASFSALVRRHTTPDEIIAVFNQAASGPLKGILAVSDAPLVSIDFKGGIPSSVLDAASIKVVMGDMIQLMIWHDNESSYCQRIIALVRYMTAAQGRE